MKEQREGVSVTLNSDEKYASVVAGMAVGTGVYMVFDHAYSKGHRAWDANREGLASQNIALSETQDLAKKVVNTHSPETISFTNQQIAKNEAKIAVLDKKEPSGFNPAEGVAAGAGAVALGAFAGVAVYYSAKRAWLSAKNRISHKQKTAAS